MSTIIPKKMRAPWRPQSIRRNTDGSATVEFAFGMIFLIFLLFGVFNLGLVIEQNIRLASAARAGAQYGSHSLARSYDSDGIATAVRSDANDVDNLLSVSSVRLCTCPETEESTDCLTSCAAAESPQAYVSVTVEREVAFFLPFPGFEDEIDLSHTVAMRVR